MRGIIESEDDGRKNKQTEGKRSVRKQLITPADVLSVCRE